MWGLTTHVARAQGIAGYGVRRFRQVPRSDTIRFMTLRVLLFASYAEAIGGSEIDLDVPIGATVADVLATLRKRPGADRLPPAPLVAVNQRYATPSTRVTERDEVAIIPPVAGG